MTRRSRRRRMLCLIRWAYTGPFVWLRGEPVEVAAGSQQWPALTGSPDSQEKAA